MAGGYEVPAVGDFAVLRAELADVRRRLEVLERPNGTQIVLEDESEREDADGFAVTTSQTDIVTIDYVCPPYDSKANFILGGQSFVFNPTGAIDYLGIQVRATGSVFGAGSGNLQQGFAASNRWASVATGYAFDVPTEAGETVSIVLRLSAANANWAADANNTASLWFSVSHKIRA